MINCPRCNTQMKEIDYEGVRIDTCPGCEGEWLDADELKKIVARREEVFTSDEIAKVRETIDEPQAVSQDELKEALSCPCCNVPMERLPRRAVFFRCPVCGAETALLYVGEPAFTPRCCNVDMDRLAA